MIRVQPQRLLWCLGELVVLDSALALRSKNP